MYTKRAYAAVPRTFGGFFGDVLQHGWNHINDEIGALSAPVNIQETEKSYDIHLVAPGLKKEDFKLNIEQDTLQISVEHKTENNEQQDTKWIRNEYRNKSFKRSFALNGKVDTANVSAKYTDGVLVVTLPKKEATKPAAHEITVN